MHSDFAGVLEVRSAVQVLLGRLPPLPPAAWRRFERAAPRALHTAAIKRSLMVAGVVV